MAFWLALQRLQNLLIGFFERACSKNAFHFRPFRHAKGFDRSQSNQALGTGQQETRNEKMSSRPERKPRARTAW